MRPAQKDRPVGGRSDPNGLFLFGVYKGATPVGPAAHADMVRPLGLAALGAGGQIGTGGLLVRAPHVAF